MISWGLVMVTLPFSLFVCFKVVQEYERAVIFRLGRLLHGGSRGPGIFFVLPCIESYQKVDLRTITLGVPPQEVGHSLGLIIGLYPVPSILQFILPPLLDIVVSFSSHWLRPEWARHRSVVKRIFFLPFTKKKINCLKVKMIIRGGGGIFTDIGKHLARHIFF